MNGLQVIASVEASVPRLQQMQQAQVTADQKRQMRASPYGGEGEEVDFGDRWDDEVAFGDPLDDEMDTTEG